MQNPSLRKVKESDITYFSKWWRDGDLISLTSGNKKLLSDKEVTKYFKFLLAREWEFMITIGAKTIGHISLVKRRNRWYETQIIIGDRKEWGKGYGTEAIKKILQKVKHSKIKNIYLEVRPNNIRAIRAYEKCGFKATKIINYPHNRNLPQTVRMEYT